MDADDDFPHTGTICRQDLHGRNAPRVPAPETIFFRWLLSLPAGVDVDAAARRQIEVIDRRRAFHPDAERLRALFAAAAGESSRPTFVN